MRAEVDGQRTARTGVSLGYVLDEWLSTVGLEDSTRETYVGYIDRTIARPSRRVDCQADGADAGGLLRRAPPLPNAVQRPPGHRAP
jgi:hypothetical protein